LETIKETSETKELQANTLESAFISCSKTAKRDKTLLCKVNKN